MSLSTSAVKSNAQLIRLVLYFLLGMWSLLLFVFCVVRLAYTLTPRSERFLMDGPPFSYPSVVELLVCSVLGFGFSIFMFTAIHYRRESDHGSRNWFEVSFLFLLWMLWLGGAATASTVWPDLSSCIMFSPCQILQALMAWAWLGWLSITFLYVPTLWIVAAARNWHDNCFDTWSYSRIATPSLRAPNAGISGGTHRVPDPDLPSVRALPETSLRSQIEREVQAKEAEWNFEKEAAKIRARLNSWMGDRRRSRAARAAAGVDLERGRPDIRDKQVRLDQKQERKNLPPLPPYPLNGALRLNVGDRAPRAS